MKLPAFDYAAPRSLEEAVALLSEHDGARPLSGGQSLLPIMAFRLAQPSMLVDLGRIPGLDGVQLGAQGLTVGARTTWRQIQDDPRIATGCPLLSAAIPYIAHYQIRNRGTIGGSLAHADPAAELPAIALACEAEIETIRAAGRRRIALRDLFTGPLMTCLDSDEIIVVVHFPPWPAARRWGFEEFARRRGDFALAGAALFYDLDSQGRASGAHIAAIGAADTPIRLNAAEAALNGRAVDKETIAFVAKAASEAVDPSSDIHATGAYRKSLVGVMVERALSRAAA